jgi:hypothetical protein
MLKAERRTKEGRPVVEKEKSACRHKIKESKPEKQVNTSCHESEK